MLDEQLFWRLVADSNGLGMILHCPRKKYSPPLVNDRYSRLLHSIANMRLLQAVEVVAPVAIGRMSIDFARAAAHSYAAKTNASGMER